MKNIINFKSAMLSLFVAGTLFFACKPDRSIINKNGGAGIQSVYDNFAQFRKSFNKNIQRFTVNMSTGGKIVGDKGYTFWFRPGSILNQLGQTITGEINVDLIEVTDAQSMLATGAGTVARNGILGSAGMFKLEVTYQGQPTYVNSQKPIVAQVMVDPNVNMKDISLFSGNESMDSTTKDTSVIWNWDSSYFNYDSLREVYDSLYKVYLQKRCITFELGYASWCNLDMYYNEPSGHYIDLEVPEAKNNLDTRVFIYINEEYTKGLFELWKDGDIHYHCKPYNLPIGWNIKIIVVTRDANRMVKYQVKDVVNQPGAYYYMSNLNGISDEDLEKFFKNL